MPTLDHKQITDKLNAEFAGEMRKIIFWYDDDKEFADVVDDMGIVGATIHKLTSDNQFYTKHLLEREDTESNFLVYAPFSKPDVRDNVLEDTLLYSRRFHADRASLLVVDLQVDEKLKPVFQIYSKFFRDMKRTQRFYDFETELTSKETIEVTIMSALCKTRTASFEEALRVVLTSGDFEDNQLLNEFEKYNLLPAFWKMCEESVGYSDPAPCLLRLSTTMFATYAAKQLRGEVPKAWKGFVSLKSGSIIAFLDSLMNSVIYRSHYDELAVYISSILKVKENLSAFDIELILDCDAFSEVDEYIIIWITERLMDEDTGATCGGKNILDICDIRIKKHYGEVFSNRYGLLSSAYKIISNARYSCTGQYENIVKQYIDKDYQIDRQYRQFHVAFDAVSENEAFEELRKRIENIYTNKYLSVLLPVYNTELNVKDVMRVDNSQLRFFDRNIKNAKDKTAIIISDALRYEVGQELFEKLNSDPNCSAEIKYLTGVLPAYTALGMAALLPHKDIQLSADGKVTIDGKQSDSTEKREAILQSALSNSRCVRFDDIPIKRDEIREIFTGKDAVYIYHDQIDKRGSSAENEVFSACTEAINEIFTLIKRLSVNNVYRFIITADHGFLYKRDKFNESEKIDLSGQKGAFTNRRFIIGDNPLVADGVVSVLLSDITGGNCKKYVSWPIGANVFKTSGGLNYVHGGASPQEMILPLITVKTKKGHVDTGKAEIALVSMIRKITNLITPLDFIQKEPVCDVVTPADYRLCFVSDNNEKISNEQIYQADRKDADPSKRMFRLKFNFKNKKYSNTEQYWLVAVEEKSNIELFRHQVVMDIAFADGIGFGF